MFGQTPVRTTLKYFRPATSLPTLLGVTGLAIYVFVVMRVVIDRFDLETPFSKVHAFGRDCEGAIGEIESNWSAATVQTTPVVYFPYPVPARKYPNQKFPPLRRNQYLTIRCRLDLSILEPTGYGVLNLVWVVGDTTVFLNGREVLKQGTGPALLIPLAPSDRVDNSELVIVVENRQEQELLGGLRSSLPPYFSDDRGASAVIERISSGEVTRSFYFFELTAAFFCLFVTLVSWVTGRRNDGVAWLLITSTGYLASKFIDYYWAERSLQSILDLFQMQFLTATNFAAAAAVFSSLRGKSYRVGLVITMMSLILIRFVVWAVDPTISLANVMTERILKIVPAFIVCASVFVSTFRTLRQTEYNASLGERIWCGIAGWTAIVLACQLTMPRSLAIPLPALLILPVVATGAASYLRSLFRSVRILEDRDRDRSIHIEELDELRAMIQRVDVFVDCIAPPGESGDFGDLSFRFDAGSRSSHSLAWFHRWKGVQGARVFLIGRITGYRLDAAIVAATIQGVLHARGLDEPDEAIAAVNHSLLECYHGLAKTSVIAIRIVKMKAIYAWAFGPDCSVSVGEETGLEPNPSGGALGSGSSPKPAVLKLPYGAEGTILARIGSDIAGPETASGGGLSVSWRENAPTLEINWSREGPSDGPRTDQSDAAARTGRELD